MAADERSASFEEFVTARWAALYRTAYLLTGARADAEDVLQATLIKAFTSWAKVGAAQSSEAYVRKMLVNHFLSSRRLGERCTGEGPWCTGCTGRSAASNRGPRPIPTVYWHDGVLHADHVTIQTPLHEIVAAGGTVLVGYAHGADPSRWSLVDGDRLVPVTQAPEAFFPKLSADGRLVVWETIHPQVTRITAWDVASQQVVGQRDVQIQQASCCGGGPSLLLFGADNRGQVFYGDGRTLTVWTPATGGVHTVTGYGRLPALPSAVTPFGLVFQGQGPTMFDLPGVYGTVDARGAFHRQGATPTDSGVWSPDGTLFAYPADISGAVDNKNPRTTVYVYDLRGGQSQKMGLPLGAGVPMAWEDTNSLLVEGGRPLDGSNHVLRCDATSGGCEVALRYHHYRRWSFGWM